MYTLYGRNVTPETSTNWQNKMNISNSVGYNTFTVVWKYWT